MRVLVTGLGGFVGSSLRPALEKRGHDVRVAPRDASALEKALDGCEAVVHLANIAHARAAEEALRRVNVEGSVRAAELARAKGVRRFVYVSSAKAEAPDDRYGRTKRAAEQALEALARRTALELAIVRPPLVYGPGVKANFLALMRAIDRGWPLPFAAIDNRRSFVYVANLCDALARCLEAREAAGRTFAVSDGTPVSTPELCRRIGAALERPARLLALPAPLLGLLPGMRKLTGSAVVDEEPIRRELGWRAPFSMDEGLRATARWYRGG